MLYKLQNDHWPHLRNVALSHSPFWEVLYHFYNEIGMKTTQESDFSGIINESLFVREIELDDVSFIILDAEEDLTLTSISSQAQ